MAQKSINAKKIVRAYSSSLTKQLRIDGVFLFGSAARGELHKDSDIDFIVLSRDFEHMPFLKRLQFLNRMRDEAASRVPMDIIGYTPKEFASMRRSESPNLRKVYREAKKVYP